MWCDGGVSMKKDNQIRDGGFRAILSAAVHSMPKLAKLWVESNQITAVGVDAMAKSIRAGALSKLSHLGINANLLADAGVVSLAHLSADGFLPKLRLLFLHNSQITREGFAGLSLACARGAFKVLEELSNFSHPPRMQVLTTASSPHRCSKSSRLDSTSWETMAFLPSPEHAKSVRCNSCVSSSFRGVLSEMLASNLWQIAWVARHCPSSLQSTCK